MDSPAKGIIALGIHHDPEGALPEQQTCPRNVLGVVEVLPFVTKEPMLGTERRAEVLEDEDML